VAAEKRIADLEARVRDMQVCEPVECILQRYCNCFWWLM